MRDLLRRVLHRATGALLRPLEDQARAQQRELIARLERLEKRMDSALAKGQAEARLLAARIDAGGAKPARRLGARVPGGPARSGNRDDGPAEAKRYAGTDIVDVASCTVCGHAESTIVCEYNRFLLSGTAPDDH